MGVFSGNWVDLIILLILACFIWDSRRSGFWFILADFGSFLGSLLISLRLYKFPSDLLEKYFDLSNSISNALGFILTAIILEMILGNLFLFLISKIPKKIRESKFNKLLGILPALGQGLVLIAFTLTAVMSLPVKPQVKRDVSYSKLGGYILKQTSRLESSLNEVFGGVIEDALTYVTVKPGSKDSIPLEVEVEKLEADTEAEAQMFNLVNEERKKAGVKELEWAPNIVPVSRSHAKDMWERKYFSHYSPEGDDVGDRLNKAKIKYYMAGENLALAPTVQTAHTGLMNSEGHRHNILDPGFGKVGIGVIDNGFYGKMFVQVFTN